MSLKKSLIMATAGLALSACTSRPPETPAQMELKTHTEHLTCLKGVIDDFNDRLKANSNPGIREIRIQLSETSQKLGGAIKKIEIASPDKIPVITGLIQATQNYIQSMSSHLEFSPLESQADMCKATADVGQSMNNLRSLGVKF